MHVKCKISIMFSQLQLLIKIQSRDQGTSRFLAERGSDAPLGFAKGVGGILKSSRGIPIFYKLHDFS